MIAFVVQGAEAQQTEQVITALIVLLLVVAVLLTVLTVWYWRHTSPRRIEPRVGRTAPPVDHDPRYYQHDAHQQPYGNRSPSGGYGHHDEHAPVAAQHWVLGDRGRR